MQSDKVAILTKKTALEFEKISNPVLQEYNLTYAQYKILKYLFSHQKDQVRQVDLEKFYSLTHPTTIGLLEQLEKKGFVQRQTNPSDARSRIITLTNQSLEMKDELENIGEILEMKLTAALTKEEKIQLVRLLQKLLTEFE
ncbi:MAG: MarR family transcriptional regulator [Lachnospiraceae bacterium]|nr:MarR family transcriptional regulator [Lachnospiraceae bacterium]